LGQLKSTLYARMEEVSFRSGAAVAGGVLTAAGVAITLAVVLGGRSDAVASAPASRVAIPSVAPPVLAPVSSSPPATPPATPRASRTTAPATVARAYQPPSATRAAATLHAAPPGRVVTPRRLVPRAPAASAVARLAKLAQVVAVAVAVGPVTASPPPLIVLWPWRNDEYAGAARLAHATHTLATRGRAGGSSCRGHPASPGRGGPNLGEKSERRAL
jgi:hypothetical protein